MGQADRIFRWSFTLLIGISVAAGVAAFAALLWWPLFWIVFVLLSACWLALVIDGMRRQSGGENLAVLDSSRDWRAKELPPKFQFIDERTTIGEIAERVGPYTKIRGEDDVRAAQFDLPDKAAVLVFAEPPFGNASRVCGVKFYPDRDFISMFP